MSGCGLVVMVCTGNVCRSPMAEYLLRAHLGRSGAWTVVSAGVAAAFGIPASSEAVDVMRERGIDLSLHSSRPLTAELAREADLLVVMTAEHQLHVEMLYPDAAGKVRLLKEFAPRVRDINLMDPIGMSRDVYRQVRNEIEAALPGLVTFLEKERESR